MDDGVRRYGRSPAEGLFRISEETKLCLELRKERDRYKNEAARWRGYYYRLWRYYKWQKGAV